MILIDKKNRGLNNGGLSILTSAITDQEQNDIVLNFKNGLMTSGKAVKLKKLALMTVSEEDTSRVYDGCPSKFLISCLNKIENDLNHNGAFVDEKLQLPARIAVSYSKHAKQYIIDDRINKIKALTDSL
ncbi:unnamed protein product [Cuscuta europaea]|uniref:Uncharacterized protein n=1 Tax=Cuscuta europaea TaxID=41803 RepID=A0A9P0Z3P7_CUSEU|nr:unnamed protein product [Cuscuta europaea]